MRKIIFILCANLPYFLVGQFTFKNNPIDTIKIVSIDSGEQHDSCGTIIGRVDEFLIVFEHKKNKYLIQKYEIEEFLMRRIPNETKTKNKIVFNEKDIEQSKVKIFLQELETKYKKPDFTSINITKSKFLTLTNQNKIKEFIKDSGYHIDHHNFQKNIQHIDTFNLFLSTGFDTCRPPFFSNMGTCFAIFLSNTQYSTHFSAKYHNPFLQPWYDYSRENEEVIPMDTNKIRKANFCHLSVLNLSINETLADILPDKFLNKSRLEIPSLIEDYFRWYRTRLGYF